MKHLIILLTPVLFMIGCSSSKTTCHSRKHPGSHILTSDKKVIRDNIRYRKEHAKAARKKREELAVYLYHNNISTHNKTKKNKREDLY